MNPIQAFTYFNHRFFVWVHYAKVMILFHVTSPILFILSLGFGMTKLMTPEIASTYLAYIVPGFACSSLMLATNLNVYSTYRTIERGIMTGIMVTPIRLSEITAGEIAYGAFRGFIVGGIVIVLGVIMGEINLSLSLLAAAGFLVLAALTMAAMSTSLAASVKNNELCDLITPIVNMPSLLFCGVFVPVVNYPEWAQNLITIYPLYHVVELVRPAINNTLTFSGALPHLVYMLCALTVFSYIAHDRMKKRLVD